MSLECRVQIRIHSLPRSKAAAVLDALGPDNVGFPEGQSVRMGSDSDSVEITVEGGTPGQFIATVDEILEHAQVALEATSQ